MAWLCIRGSSCRPKVFRPNRRILGCYDRKKGIHSLPARAVVLRAANRRLEFISTINTPTGGVDALRKISASLREGEYAYPGLNHTRRVALATVVATTGIGRINATMPRTISAGYNCKTMSEA